MRRRLLSTATLIVAFVVLVVMAIWGEHALTAPTSTTATATAQRPCTPAEITVQHWVTRKQVAISVYNAGAKTGFAGVTAHHLASLGFRIATVANAPTHVAKAEVLTTQTNDPAARLVAAAIGKKTPISVASKPIGPGIEVYVGAGFRHLSAHAPTRMRLPHPVSTCVRVS